MESKQDRIIAESIAGGNVVYNFTQTDESSIYLTVNQRIVRITTVADGADLSVYLPPVSAAIGKFYNIMLIARGDDEVVSIKDLDDSLDWSDITDMDAVNDSVLLFSDGLKWTVVKNDIA